MSQDYKWFNFITSKKNSFSYNKTTENPRYVDSIQCMGKVSILYYALNVLPNCRCLTNIRIMKNEQQKSQSISKPFKLTPLISFLQAHWRQPSCALCQHIPLHIPDFSHPSLSLYANIQGTPTVAPQLQEYSTPLPHFTCQHSDFIFALSFSPSSVASLIIKPLFSISIPI